MSYFYFLIGYKILQTLVSFSNTFFKKILMNHFLMLLSIYIAHSSSVFLAPPLSGKFIDCKTLMVSL